VAANTLRVDIGLLDKVMDLVGELALARNQVLQYTAN
jgi:two-component system chemotaxis sensor kinase CheA